jgi:hypothetical protein
VYARVLHIYIYNWLNIKRAILEATKESLGYKPIEKKTWIRTWTEELKQTTDRKEK